MRYRGRSLYTVVTLPVGNLGGMYWFIFDMRRANPSSNDMKALLGPGVKYKMMRGAKHNRQSDFFSIWLNLVPDRIEAAKNTGVIEIKSDSLRSEILAIARERFTHVMGPITDDGILQAKDKSRSQRELRIYLRRLRKYQNHLDELHKLCAIGDADRSVVPKISETKEGLSSWMGQIEAAAELLRGQVMEALNGHDKT